MCERRAPSPGGSSSQPTDVCWLVSRMTAHSRPPGVAVSLATSGPELSLLTPLGQDGAERAWVRPAFVTNKSASMPGGTLPHLKSQCESNQNLPSQFISFPSFGVRTLSSGHRSTLISLGLHRESQNWPLTAVSWRQAGFQKPDNGPDFTLR